MAKIYHQIIICCCVSIMLKNCRGENIRNTVEYIMQWIQVGQNQRNDTEHTKWRLEHLVNKRTQIFSIRTKKGRELEDKEEN